jgi:transposase
MSMEIAQNAIKYVEEGYTLKEAAKLLGVGYTTLAGFITSNPQLRRQYYEARARASRKKKK